MAIHPVLDRMVLMLDQAWISEIRQDQKPLVQRFKAVVQSFQNPYVVPLEAQLQNLMEASAERRLRHPLHEMSRRLVSGDYPENSGSLLVRTGKKKRGRLALVAFRVLGEGLGFTGFAYPVCPQTAEKLNVAPSAVTIFTWYATPSIAFGTVKLTTQLACGCSPDGQFIVHVLACAFTKKSAVVRLIRFVPTFRKCKTRTLGVVQS